MKIFLLLCITYLISAVNKPYVSHEKCGYSHFDKPFYYDHTGKLNALAAAGTVYVLGLPKEHAEIIGEMALVLILSIIATALPMNLFLQIGSRAAKFSDLIGDIDDTILGPTLTEDSFSAWFNSSAHEVSSTVMYAGVIAGFAGQSYLADWLLELTVKDATRAELLIMQVAFCLPLMIATFIKHQTKTISLWIIDSLPLSGIIFPLFPSLMCIYHMETPPNPIAFKVPFDKWKNLTRTLGYYFVYRWYSLLARLGIKYNINTYDGMIALRGYFYTRVIRNFLKMPYDSYTLTNLTEMLCFCFCQDYMSVTGASAVVSRIVKWFGSFMITLGKDDKSTKVESYALGFMPFCHIVLEFINVYYECEHCERIENMFAAMTFLLIIFCSYMYTSAWQEAIGSVSYTTMKKHTEYLKVFFFLIIMPAGGAFFFSGVRSSGDHELAQQCCYHDLPLPEGFDDLKGNDYDPMAFFAYQVSLFSLLSTIAIGLIMAYTWIYIEPEESEEGFEGRLQTTFAAMVGLEMFVSVLIFDHLSKYCCRRKSHQYMLMGMALSNMYCTVFDRGIGIAYKIYSSWKDMKGVFEGMQTLGEKELEDMDEKTCTICDDEIEENGRLAGCTHMFHYFCIREWIGQYGPTCPECSQEFKSKNKREYAPPEETEEDQDPGKLDPRMIDKILTEMEKFDAKTTFFSEASDNPETKKDGEEGEGGDE